MTLVKSRTNDPEVIPWLGYPRLIQTPSTPLVHVCHCQKNDTLDILNIQGKNTVSFHGLHGLHILLSLFPSFQIQIRLKRPSIQRGEADLGAIDQVLEREVAKLSHDPQLSPRVSILSHGLQSWGYHTWGTPKNGWKNNLKWKIQK